MLTSEVLHTLWCRLVCRNSVKLNFVKTGLKFEFGVNPQSFSHELCVLHNEIRKDTVASVSVEREHVEWRGV